MLAVEKLGAFLISLKKIQPTVRFGTFQLQPLVVRTLVALDGRLDLGRFFAQIMTRNIHRVTELNEKIPLSNIGEIRPSVALL